MMSSFRSKVKPQQDSAVHCFRWTSHLMAAFSVVFLLASTSFALAKPNAQIAPSEFDFGTVREGSQLEHEFSVKNTGDGPLVIQKVVPSCGCTVATFTQGEISPGTAGSLKVKLDTSGMSGRKERTVRLLVNNPDEPSITLQLRVNVEQGAAATPSFIDFGTVTKGKSVSSQKFSVSLGRNDSKFLSVLSSSGMIQVAEGSSTATTKNYLVTLSDGVPTGEFRERVIVTYSGAQGEELVNIPVIGKVEGPVHVEPTVISFGVLKGEKVLPRRIKVENNTDKPIRISAVKSSESGILSKVVTIDDGRRYVVEISVDPTKISSTLRGFVDIVTDSLVEPKITIGVYALLPPAKS